MHRDVFSFSCFNCLVNLICFHWLQSGKAAAFEKRLNDSSAVRIVAENSKCHVKYDHDILVDVDLLPLNHHKSDQCCDLCMTVPKCRGFAWNEDKNGTCWLKASSGPFIEKKNVIAGYVIIRKSESYEEDAEFEHQFCTALPNITIYGGGTRAPKIGEYSASCCRRCADDPECDAYTWNDGQCTLHRNMEKDPFNNTLFQRVATPGIHSGILRHRPKPSSNFTWLIGLIIAVVFVSMLVGLIYSCRLLRKERRVRHRLQKLENALKTKGDLDRLDLTVALSEQAELLEFKEQFEFPRTRLRVLDVVLGSGQYGKVVLGEARDIVSFTLSADAHLKHNKQASQKKTSLHQRWSKVAVKVARDPGSVVQLKMLMAELKVHMFVGHHLNVVNLLGAVTKNFQFGEMFVLLEYCRYGSLKSFLVRHRSDLNFLNQVTAQGELVQLDQNVLNAKLQRLDAHTAESHSESARPNIYGPLLTSNDLVSFAYQLASGMAYLAQKLVIHRDLAARNVLVTDNLVVKISDFGLAREGVRCEQDGTAEYSRSPLKTYGDEPLPVKWVAPECVIEARFSTPSDVWSYGITLWEIFSLGGDPYPGDIPSEEFFQRLFFGYRMQRPILAPRQMYTIMQLCWDIDPQQRPNFIQLQELVSKMTNNDELVKYQTLYAQEPYQYMQMMSNSGVGENSQDEDSPLFPPPEASSVMVILQLEADHRNEALSVMPQAFVPAACATPTYTTVVIDEVFEATNDGSQNHESSGDVNVELDTLNLRGARDISTDPLLLSAENARDDGGTEKADSS